MKTNQKNLKFIVYLTINKVNNKKYIGVHKYKSLKDGYLGSGVALLSAIKKYGRRNFKRVVLFKFDNEIDAYTKEAALVTFEVVNDPNYYNLVLGGDVGGISPPPSQKTPIKAINLQTLEVLYFNSAVECAKHFDIHFSTVSRICIPENRRKQAKGWTFRNEKHGDFPIYPAKKIGRPKSNQE